MLGAARPSLFEPALRNGQVVPDTTVSCFPGYPKYCIAMAISSMMMHVIDIDCPPVMGSEGYAPV